MPLLCHGSTAAVPCRWRCRLPMLLELVAPPRAAYTAVPRTSLSRFIASGSSCCRRGITPLHAAQHCSLPSMLLASVAALLPMLPTQAARHPSAAIPAALPPCRLHHGSRPSTSSHAATLPRQCSRHPLPPALRAAFPPCCGHAARLPMLPTCSRSSPSCIHCSPPAPCCLHRSLPYLAPSPAALPPRCLQHNAVLLPPAMPLLGYGSAAVVARCWRCSDAAAFLPRCLHCSPPSHAARLPGSAGAASSSSPSCLATTCLLLLQPPIVRQMLVPQQQPSSPHCGPCSHPTALLTAHCSLATPSCATTALSRQRSCCPSLLALHLPSTLPTSQQLFNTMSTQQRLHRPAGSTQQPCRYTDTPSTPLGPPCPTGAAHLMHLSTTLQSPCS
jgi:hypothetical protein